MSSSIPQEALIVPVSSAEAVSWIEVVVAWIGPRFDPQESFRAYGSVRHSGKYLDLDEREIGALDQGCAATVALLGERARDLAYREATEYLERIDGGWKAWARPVTQPPPRWWLVERAHVSAAGLDPARRIAFEDQRGVWWTWEPAMQLLYSDEPWLFTDFYYHLAAQRDRLLETEVGPMRFTQLTPADARRLIGRLGWRRCTTVPRGPASPGGARSEAAHESLDRGPQLR